MKNGVVFSGIILLGATQLGYAENAFSNANKISDYKANKSFYHQYLNGVMNGYFWANSYSSSQLGGRIFCIPENLTPSDINYIRILDTHIENKANAKREEFIEVSLLFALVEKFPCSET